MRRRWILALMLVAALATAAALLLIREQSRTVETAEVTRGRAIALVYATGFVEPAEPVVVSSRVTAPVRQVLVEEGQRVSPGQPLVLLDQGEQRGQLDQAEAELRRATLAANRALALYAKGWVTRAARDEAVAARDSARAAEAALRARMDQYVIRAGVAGEVLTRDVYPGDLAMPGKQLMQLGDPARVQVTATVDERDINRVRVGQAALMSSEALDGVVRGRVSRITPGGDPTQRAFRVRIAPDEGRRLPFGLTLEVNIVTSRRDGALLVPAGAIRNGRVLVVEDGQARARKVTTGITGSEKTEVRSGLKPGERIILHPPDGLDDGMRVRER